MKLPLVPLFVSACSLLTTLAYADVLIVTDTTGDRVVRVNPASAVSPIISSGLITPEQAIYDSAGNLFVADSGLNQVIEFPYPADGTTTPVPFGVSGATALAVDATGNVYAASSTDRTVLKLVSNAFTPVATLPAGHAPRALAVTPGGDIFVADNVGSTIYRITAGASTATTFSTDVTSPYAVAIDTAGKVHATDTRSGGRIASFTGNGNNPGNNSRDDVTGLGVGIRGLAYDQANTAYFLTSAGELMRVSGNAGQLVVGSLGDPRLLTVRSATTKFVAYKGQLPPVPAGASFATVGSPAIGAGFTAFKATLVPGVVGVDTTNNLGIWRADAAGTLTLLARKGVAAASGGAPGLPNDKLVTFGDPVLNGSGKIAFVGTLRPGTATVTTANTVRIFSDVNVANTLMPVLAKGDQAPGSIADPLDATVKFTGFKQVVLPDDAGPAVLATVAGTGITTANNLGIWAADTSGSFELIARKGQMVTFPDKARKLTTLSVFTPTPLSLGQGRNTSTGRKFVFRGTFSDGVQALLLAQPNQSLTVLKAKLDSVNNADPAFAGAKFGTFNLPCVSDNAAIYGFFTKLLSVSTSSAATTLLTSGSDLVEGRATYAAPVVPGVSNPIFASVGDPVVNAGGAAAFLGKLKVGTAFPGVLSSTAAILCQDLAGTGNPSLAQRQGDVAPDVTGGAKFTAFRQFVLPDAQGVVFTATIAGSGITTANNFGLWANDGAGSTSLLLRKGDKLKLPIGNQTHTITVTGINIFKALVGVTGQTRHFDHDGTVACQITGLDGSAPFQAVLKFVRP